MSDFEITFEDNGMIEKLAASPEIVREELIFATDRITTEGVNYAKNQIIANGSVVTSTLLRSIASTPATFAGGGVSGSFGTAVPYAKYVEFGRGPVVARGRALRFTVGGKTVYAKRVGPAAPRPFMKPTVAKLRPLVNAEYGAAMQRIGARLGLG